MQKRLLNKGDFKPLFHAFRLAFSSNKVPFNFSQDEFDYRIHKKLTIDYDLSAAVFDGEEMIGFMLHTYNIYEGLPTAFNAGTGVIPGFRNQKTGEELYAYLIPRLINKSVPRVVLEVIDTNDSAIHLYEKIGFQFKRRFHCFKRTSDAPLPATKEVSIGSLNDLNEDFMDFLPSFADSRNQLIKGEEMIRIAKEGNQLLGFIIFQPHIGRISQIAVSRNSRNLGVGTSLLCTAAKLSEKPLTIMNIPENEVGMQHFLRRHGFENQVNQFEMELII